MILDSNMSKMVNEDLQREREKCSFNILELIYIVDGGIENTKKRKETENLVLSVKELKDEIPEEYLSHKEKYENAVRKAFILCKLMKDHIQNFSMMENYQPSNKINVLYGVTKDVSPILLHLGMFIPTIIGQSSDEQLAEWLPKALAMEHIGTYAQTELGHGTFLKGLETTATYDPSTEEFVINSPTLTSYKWWPGGLGHTANHCIVVAQLHTQGKLFGIHPFLVQIRDMETHMPLPGVKVGEIGPKLGFQTANNGFLGFNNFRIPRKNMLMKNAQVLKDGTYAKLKTSKLAYGTMVFVRVNIVNDMAFYTSKAATIAVRYSAVRRQSKPKEDLPEPQIIDYVTQQHKIFITIASSHAYRVVCQWLWTRYLKVIKGNLDHLPELHAFACCLKAVSTKDASRCIEDCRLACGGHGYMQSSNLPITYGLAVAACTYEGDNTVLHLQTARYLVKAWEKILDGKSSPILYHGDFSKKRNCKWKNSPEGIIIGFQVAGVGKLKAAYNSIEKHVRSGKDYEDAWNLASVELVNASEAHCREVICETFWSETQRIASTASTELGVVLKQLAELYLVYWTLEKSGDLLLYSTLSRSDIVVLQQRYEELLALIRPNAVGLVDAFDIRDEILNSTLGAYDGRVYERLMEQAIKSPLNQQPVNESFHKYIKPFKANL